MSIDSAKKKKKQTNKKKKQQDPTHTQSETWNPYREPSILGAINHRKIIQTIQLRKLFGGLLEWWETRTDHMTVAKGSEGSVSARKKKKSWYTNGTINNIRRVKKKKKKKLGQHSVLPCIAFICACWLLSLHTCHSEIQPLECFQVMWRASYGVVSVGEVSGDKASRGASPIARHFSLLSTQRLIGKNYGVCKSEV